MHLEQHKTIKQKPEYPVLQKTLGNDPGEFELLQAAYTPDEMRQHEHRLATESWDAKFVPQLVRDAKTRLPDRVPQ